MIIPSYNYRGGHPVLLNKSIKQTILEESKDSNLKEVFSKHSKKYIVIEDEAIITDIDTTKDLEKLVKLY